MNIETVLAFDYGEQKTGLAIGNTLTYLARPLRTLTHPPLKPDFAEIRLVIDDWRPTQLLVGLPLLFDGTENDFCRSCRKFAGRLAHQFSLPVYFYNEQLSSAEAEASLKAGNNPLGKKHKNFNNKKQQQLRDQVAAQIILQRYFDDLSIGRDNRIR